MTRRLACLLLLLLARDAHAGGALTPEESRRSREVIARLNVDLAAAPTAGRKLAVLQAAMRAERAPWVRDKVTGLADSLPVQEKTTFMVGVLASDPLASSRCCAAIWLGLHGTAACVPALAKAARDDPTTEVRWGDVVGEGNARAAAIHALADVAERLPAEADRVMAVLYLLEVEEPAEANARSAALYRVTHDEDLLKPLLALLTSTEASTRARGAYALGRANLKRAPGGLVRLLGDRNLSVAVAVATVIGQIGDVAAVPELVQAARDTGRPSSTRCPAISALGQMRSADASAALKRLLGDPDPRVADAAARALEFMAGATATPAPTAR